MSTTSGMVIDKSRSETVTWRPGPEENPTRSVAARLLAEREAVLRGVHDEASPIEYYVGGGNRQVAERDRYLEARAGKAGHIPGLV